MKTTLIPTLIAAAIGFSTPALAAPKVKKVAKPGAVVKLVKAGRAALAGKSIQTKPSVTLGKKSKTPDTTHGAGIPADMAHLDFSKADTSRLAREIMIQVNAHKKSQSASSRKRTRTPDTIYGLGIPAELADLNIESPAAQARALNEIMIQVDAYNASKKVTSTKSSKTPDTVYGLGIPPELAHLNVETKADRDRIATEIMAQVEVYKKEQGLK